LRLLLHVAKAYLEKQDIGCHHAWKKFLKGDGARGSNNKRSVIDLLKDLGTLARRVVLKLSLDESQSFHTKRLMNEASQPVVELPKKN
jgi:hypothetical protein